MAIQMTRVQYEAKYGTPPPVPISLAQPAVQQSPTVSEPIKMTRAEYQAKYGTPPPITPLEKQRSVFGKVAHFLAPTATELATGEKELNLRTGIGAGLELASFAIPVGGIAKGAGLAAKGLGLAAKGFGRRALEAGTVAAVTGGTQQAGVAIGEGAGVGETIKRAGKGAIIAAPFGVATVPVAAGVSKVIGRFQAKAAEKAAQTAALKARVPEASIATKALTPEGKLVTDKIGKEAVRQGIEEADVSLVKFANEADKTKMRKMLSIRESQFRNKRVVDRATDVAGDTFLEKVAKPLQATNRQAAKDLDVVAQGLAGRKVDVSSALTKFGDELERAGIGLRSDGKLNFKGSDFEGLKSVQSSISNVWNRARRIARTGDALQLHRAKRFVDNMVEFGAEGQGLTGNAERILKGFRRNADQLLDTRFPAYNKANTVFAETINELNKLAQIMGRRFRISDNFADARTGLVLRRIMSNTQSRSQILQLLESAQNVAKKHGAKIDEDVINQIAFADTLEKALGSEAGTSFLGGIERGIGRAQDVAGITEAFARGGIVRGTARTAQFLTDLARGVNQQNKIKALRALLGEGGEVVAKKPTVFGRKPPSIPKGPGAAATPKTAFISHPEIGEIELFIGKKGGLSGKGYGLEKIKREHPEVIPRLKELQNAKIVERLPQRLIVETTGKKPIRAVIDLQFGKEKKIWLMNAYEKRVPRE